MKPIVVCHASLGGGFQDFLFSPLLGEMIQFDSYFSTELKPPTRYCFFGCKSLKVSPCFLLSDFSCLPPKLMFFFVPWWFCFSQDRVWYQSQPPATRASREYLGLALKSRKGPVPGDMAMTKKGCATWSQQKEWQDNGFVLERRQIMHTIWSVHISF